MMSPRDDPSSPVLTAREKANANANEKAATPKGGATARVNMQELALFTAVSEKITEAGVDASLRSAG